MGGFPGAGDLGLALKGKGLPGKRMRVTYLGGRNKLGGEYSVRTVERVWRGPYGSWGRGWVDGRTPNHGNLEHRPRA